MVIRFTRARVKEPINYSLMGTLIPEASSCKYLGTILRSDLCWADEVNYTVKKAWKALHFTMRILKRCNGNIVRFKPDGTRRSTGGEVKGKDANVVCRQQPCTVRWKSVTNNNKNLRQAG